MTLHLVFCEVEPGEGKRYKRGQWYPIIEGVWGRKLHLKLCKKRGDKLTFAMPVSAYA